MRIALVWLSEDKTEIRQRSVKLFDENNSFIGEVRCKPYDFEIIDIKSENIL